MSDILSKDELRVFIVHPFYHDKIELLEKLKTRTRELVAMYDHVMTERLKKLSGAIIAFSNRESDEIY